MMRPAKLTDAEKAIATALLRGMSRQAIADSRYASVKTVDAQVANLYKRIGIDMRLGIGAIRSTLIDLIAYAIAFDSSLIDPEGTLGMALRLRDAAAPSGKTVKIVAHGGEIIERRVVAVADNTVVVCTDDEFRDAATEGRDPITVGFPVSDIVVDPRRADAR